MRFRPDALGGHCGTWDASQYRPKTSRRLAYSDYESQDNESVSSFENSNNFYSQSYTSVDAYGQALHYPLNISPVDDSNQHADSRKQWRKMCRAARQRSIEFERDLSSEVESSHRTRSGHTQQLHMDSQGFSSNPYSCSEWDISEMSSRNFKKREYRRKKGEDWEVFTIYPEPTPLKREKHEKRRRRKSVEWDTSSVCSSSIQGNKKTYSYELKKSKYWEELSSIYPREKPKNDYRTKRDKQYYEPTIPVVNKYDPSVKKNLPKFGLTSTCTKQSQYKENKNMKRDIDWAELSSIYPERDIDWSTIRPLDSTPRNMSDMSSIHPSDVTTVTTMLSEPQSICTSVIPDNPNNTLVSSVLLQQGGDPNIRNTDGKTALDLADPSAKAVLTGKHMLLYYFKIKTL